MANGFLLKESLTFKLNNNFIQKKNIFSFREMISHIVDHILFDDIVPYLPRKNDGTEFTKALLKIDIEGFEPYAFQHASKLFDKLDISVIYMEWGNIPIQTDATDIILQMIQFLTQRKFRPINNMNVSLDLNNWRNWPFNVMWLK